MGFTWRDARWSYSYSSPKQSITIKGLEVKGHVILYNPHTEVTDVVVFCQAPNGYMAKQVSKLWVTSNTWVTQIFQSNSPHNLTSVNFSCCIWRSIKYPFPVTCMGVEIIFLLQLKIILSTYFVLVLTFPLYEMAL